MLIIWSLNFIVGKIALRHMDPLSLAALRLELAALLILPIYLFRGKEARTPFRARDTWTYVFLGFFGVVINQGFFTVGLDYTTSGHSSVVVAAGPVVILLLARALKLEKITASKILGMVISIGGVALLATEQGLNFRSPIMIGDLLTFAATSGYAIYTVYGKKVAQEYDSISMNTYNMVAAAILLLPLAIWQGIRLDWGSVGWVGWGAMFYMAAFSSVAAYILFYWVLRFLSPSRVAVVSYFEPLTVVVLAAVLLGERPTGHLVAGGALVIFGVYLAERGSS
jgi:drug/metabolite transporter (DMT)-like permease